MSADGIVWQDPPPSPTIGKHDAVVAALKENPDNWALLGSYTKGASGAVVARWKARGFDATGRAAGDRRDVYVRWPAAGSGSGGTR